MFGLLKNTGKQATPEGVIYELITVNGMFRPVLLSEKEQWPWPVMEIPLHVAMSLMEQIGEDDFTNTEWEMYTRIKQKYHL